MSGRRRTAYAPLRKIVGYHNREIKGSLGLVTLVPQDVLECGHRLDANEDTGAYSRRCWKCVQEIKP